MKVYIVSTGVYHEGGSVKKVFANKKKAEEYQEKERKEDEYQELDGLPSCFYVDIEEWNVEV